MVFLQTNAGKTHTVTARGKSYRVIAVPDDLFFGIETVNAYGSSVKMTDPEKTIIRLSFSP